MKKSSRSEHRSRSGFTLVEILVVIAIIAVLMSLVIGLQGTATKSANENRAKGELAELMVEIENYKVSEGEFPADWAAFGAWYTTKYNGTKYIITDGDPDDPIDPWGNSYVYSYDSATPFVYFIASYGPNGTDDSGEVDDLTNRNGTVQ